MDRIIELSILIDFYGKLLTKKQFDIIDMHYNNDYSLGEIAEVLGITRQAVHDSLKRAESTLYSYENKLQLVNKFIMQDELIKEAILKLKDISKKNNNSDINNCIDILEKIQS